MKPDAPPPEARAALLTADNWARVRGRAASTFACGSLSLHGPSHWQRVERTGVLLCRDTGADETVVRLFAVLHDSCRRDDGRDPDHGPRAAEMIADLVGTVIPLEPDRLALLEQAIRHHAEGHISDDPTIGTCWDADRLDLGRVGIRPRDRFMSTAAGRKLAGDR